MRWIKTLVFSFGGGLLLGLLIVLGLSFGVGGKATPASARNILWRQEAIQPVQAGLDGSVFTPKVVTITVGDTVSWTINGFHSVTANDSSFNKPAGAYSNEVFTHTFGSTGVFSYFCTVHGSSAGTGMAGTVIVINAGGETATPTATTTTTPTPTNTPPPTATSGPQVARVAALKDTTIYEEDGGKSNGAGSILIAGNTRIGNARRSLIAFDLSAIPPGATVVSAVVELSELDDTHGPQTLELRKASADWGSAGSSTDQGNGAPAQPGDATWSHRFYTSSTWSAAGGDFAVTASGTATVSGTGRYEWGSNPALVADVQGWVNNSASNFGWFVLGNEVADQVSKKLASSENAVSTARPALRVNYIGAAPTCLRFDIPLAKENANIVTNASGSGRFVLNTQLNTLSYYITYTNLSSAENNAHFHAFVPPATSGSPIAGQPLSANGAPKQGVWAYGSLANAQAIEDALLAGQVYVNIHTVNNPTGEIRGNLVNPVATQCRLLQMPLLTKP